MLIDNIKVGDIMFTSEGSQREIVMISDQEDVEYPIITVDPIDHSTIATYDKEGRYMTLMENGPHLIGPVPKGTLLVSDKNEDGNYFIVMVTDYFSYQNSVFSGIVVFDTAPNDGDVGKMSSIWSKKKFRVFNGALRLKN